MGSFFPPAEALAMLLIAEWVLLYCESIQSHHPATTDFCIEAVQEALHRYGKPDIFNTDQGSQGGFNRSSQH
jgi:putative transposase